jgi:hypothetical protein
MGQGRRGVGNWKLEIGDWKRQRAEVGRGPASILFLDRAGMRVEEEDEEE